jgi:diaminopimelate epimerase
MPKEPPTTFTLSIKSKKFLIHKITMGVPHCVIYCDDIKKVDVNGIGREIRHHKKFFPEGTNVDFVQIANKNKFIFRTYERGVEEETYSCGTGALACAYVSFINGKVNRDVVCLTLIGKKFIIHLNKKIELESKVEVNFKGELEVRDV